MVAYATTQQCQAYAAAASAVDQLTRNDSIKVQLLALRMLQAVWQCLMCDAALLPLVCLRALLPSATPAASLMLLLLLFLLVCAVFNCRVSALSCV